MKVDVSEIKAFRHCRRQWQLSSRNQFHLTAVVEPEAFKLGTVFHECLHRLYLGKDIETVTTYLSNQLRDTHPDKIPMLTSMIKGYDREVMPLDQKFRVLDIEHHFNYSPLDMLDETGLRKLSMMGVDLDTLDDIEVVGSIDMIALDTETNEVWGFEHKTCKNFRKDTYLWMDEQPRLYYAALQIWVAQYNMKRYNEWSKRCTDMYNDYCALWQDWDVKGRGPDQEPKEPIYPAEPTPVKLGGVFINEVRKLVRAFDYKRHALVYPEDDIRNFMIYFLTSCAECHKYTHNPELPRLPLPDMMTCQMCMFNQICENMQYRDLNLDSLLGNFGEVVKVRENDHLEEKEEEGVDATPTEENKR